jgi:hypothetical protein
MTRSVSLTQLKGRIRVYSQELCPLLLSKELSISGKLANSTVTLIPEGCLPLRTLLEGLPGLGEGSLTCW